MNVVLLECKSFVKGRSEWAKKREKMRMREEVSFYMKNEPNTVELWLAISHLSLTTSGRPMSSFFHIFFSPRLRCAVFLYLFRLTLILASLVSHPILQKFKRHNKCNSWRFDSRLNVEFHEQNSSLSCEIIFIFTPKQ